MGWPGVTRRLALGLSIAAGLAMAGAVKAQTTPADPTAGLRSPVLTIDPDRFFAESAFGAAFEAQLRADSAALAAENAALVAELTAEERDLTDRRPDMPVEEFRAAAEAFDQRAQDIRRTQDAKEQALNARRDEALLQFLQSAQPILARVMQDRGAVVILDRRSAFLSLGAVDVTDAAIELYDQSVTITDPEAEGAEAAGDGDGSAADPAGSEGN